MLTINYTTDTGSAHLSTDGCLMAIPNGYGDGRAQIKVCETEGDSQIFHQKYPKAHYLFTIVLPEGETTYIEHFEIPAGTYDICLWDGIIYFVLRDLGAYYGL